MKTNIKQELRSGIIIRAIVELMNCRITEL